MLFFCYVLLLSLVGWVKLCLRLFWLINSCCFVLLLMKILICVVGLLGLFG